MRRGLDAADWPIAQFGMDDSLHTHLWAHLSGEMYRFLLNPCRVTFNDITASGRVILGPDKHTIEEEGYRINDAGLKIILLCTLIAAKLSG